MAASSRDDSPCSRLDARAFHSGEARDTVGLSTTVRNLPLKILAVLFSTKPKFVDPTRSFVDSIDASPGGSRGFAEDSRRIRGGFTEDRPMTSYAALFFLISPFPFFGFTRLSRRVFFPFFRPPRLRALADRIVDATIRGSDRIIVSR